MCDYISREAILKELDNTIDKCKEDPITNVDVADVCSAIMMFIDNMQAADVQPVRHGRWIQVQGKLCDNFLCSNCGTAEQTESGEDGVVWWHDEYCRKCGARMDGDKKCLVT